MSDKRYQGGGRGYGGGGDFRGGRGGGGDFRGGRGGGSGDFRGGRGGGGGDFRGGRGGGGGDFRGGRGGGGGDFRGGRGGGGGDFRGGRGGGGDFRGGRGGGGDFRGGRGGGSGDFRGGRGGRGGDFRGGRGGTFHAPQTRAPPMDMPQSEVYPRLVNQQLKPGTEGRELTLVSNFYRVIIGHVSFMHYDVHCEIVKLSKSMAALKLDNPAGDAGGGDSSVPDRFIRLFGADILKEFVLQNKAKIDLASRYVYDGEKNLYTVAPLFQGSSLSSEIKYMLNGRERIFLVKLTLVGTIPNESVHQFYEKAQGLDHLAIGAIDSNISVIYDIFFKFLIMQTHEQFRHKFFNTSRANEANNPIVNYVQGFIKSVKPTEFGLGLNVHLKTGVIISKRLIKLPDVVLTIVNHYRREAISSLENLPAIACDQVRRIIRGLKVVTSHTGRDVIYTAWDLKRETPYTSKFKRRLSDGKDVEISIAEYFMETYKKKLAKIPLVQTGNGKLIPMELCSIYKTQFLSNQKITPDIQQELLKMSTFTPDAYLNKVQNIVENIKQIDPELCNAFGVDLNTKPACITGRVLPAPKVFPGKYQGTTMFKTPCNSNKDKPFAYMLFSLQPTTKDTMAKFCQKLQTHAQKFHVELVLVETFAIEPNKPINTQTIRFALMNILKQFPNLKLLMVAIPTYCNSMPPAQMYSTIKRLSEQNQDSLVMTQCMKAEFLDNQKLGAGYFDNILMKINAKLGGENSILDNSTLNTTGIKPDESMLVGVDVNHASPGENVTCSVTAVVASMDSAFTRYASIVSVQPRSKDEIISNIGDLVSNMVLEYEKVNGRLPKNIIVMRDGVSDGQIDLIFKTEIPPVRRALDAKIKGAKLIWIVVQKRHHTRIMLTKQDTGPRNPTFNVPSGTVVDQYIVNPTKYPNFYINSHFSPLGTSKPARYVVLRNDNNLDTNHIQRLCFYLCFNCVRTNNVLAYPVAIRYADLCAYRAKLYIDSALAYNTQMPNESEMIGTLNKMAQTDPRFKKILYYV